MHLMFGKITPSKVFHQKPTEHKWSAASLTDWSASRCGHILVAVLMLWPIRTGFKWTILNIAENLAGGHFPLEPAGVVGPLNCGRCLTNCRVSFAGGEVGLIKLTLALHHCSASPLPPPCMYRECHCFCFLFFTSTTCKNEQLCMNFLVMLCHFLCFN